MVSNYAWVAIHHCGNMEAAVVEDLEHPERFTKDLTKWARRSPKPELRRVTVEEVRQMPFCPCWIEVYELKKLRSKEGRERYRIARAKAESVAQ